MRIISRKRLLEFWGTRVGQEAEQPLRAWYREACQASWKGPFEVKAQYPTASILKEGRVVFNIGGNQFRLVTAIRYDLGIVFIRFVGTHAQYGRIDASHV